MSIEPVPKLRYLNKFHIHGIVLTVFGHSYSINRDAHLRETMSKPIYKHLPKLQKKLKEIIRKRVLFNVLDKKAIDFYLIMVI